MHFYKTFVRISAIIAEHFEKRRLRKKLNKIIKINKNYKIISK